LRPVLAVILCIACCVPIGRPTLALPPYLAEALGEERPLLVCKGELAGPVGSRSLARIEVPTSMTGEDFARSACRLLDRDSAVLVDQHHKLVFFARGAELERVVDYSERQMGRVGYPFSSRCRGTSSLNTSSGKIRRKSVYIASPYEAALHLPEVCDEMGLNSFLELERAGGKPEGRWQLSVYSTSAELKIVCTRVLPFAEAGECVIED
jgi:hypothetical protein